MAEAHAARQEADWRRVENEDVERYGALFGLESRDQLLDYIRAQRDEKPTPAPQPPPLTQRMRDELEAEQRAGREAVAKAEAQLAATRDQRAREREGTVQPEGKAG